MPPHSPRHVYQRIRRPSAASSYDPTISPISSVRSASSRVTFSIRRKRVGGPRPVSPLSDTFEEEDAAVLREAAAAGVPFLNYGDVEMSSSQSWGRAGWGTPAGRSRAFSGTSAGSGDGVGNSTEGRDWHGISAIAEERREEPEDSSSKGEANEAALESGWRPGYLRRRSVVSFMAGFVALMVALEVLSTVDQANGGLGDGRGRVSVLWGYLPTISKRPKAVSQASC